VQSLDNYTSRVYGMFKYLYDGLRPSLPDAEADKHAVRGWVSEPFGDFCILCGCGEKLIEMSRAQVAAAVNSSTQALLALTKDSIVAHYRQLIAYYNPTLSEMSDWGWFSPEVW
jgi:hypothetical protein